MSLPDYLYRCPDCGKDPIEGKGNEARCPHCGIRYRRGPAPAMIRVQPPGGPERLVPIVELGRRIDGWGGAQTRAALPNGDFRYQADVEMRVAAHEEEVRMGGRLLGFVERFGDPVPGRLVLDSERLRFRTGLGKPPAFLRRRRASSPRVDLPEIVWPLLDLTALQGSSAAIQIAADEHVIEFRFPHDSPRRWEALLRDRLRFCWTEAGRPPIREFQPRITAR